MYEKRAGKNHHSCQATPSVAHNMYLLIIAKDTNPSRFSGVPRNAGIRFAGIPEKTEKKYPALVLLGYRTIPKRFLSFGSKMQKLLFSGSASISDADP